MKRCPFCSEEIEATATECPYCGEHLEEVTPSTAETAAGNTPAESPAMATAHSVEPFVEMPHHTSKTYKIVLLVAMIVSVIIAIITAKTPLQFVLFSGSLMPYWAAFTLIAIVLLIMLVYSFGEQRNGKMFLNKEGEFDIRTPRTYTALKKSGLARLLGRSHLFMGRGLSSFEYADGKISVATNKGEKIQGTFDDITWKYSKDKNKGIYKYIITNNAGEKVVFYKNDATFEDAEWNDINMLLSLCGGSDKSKASKMTQKVATLAESVKSFTDRDVVGGISNLTGLFGKKSSKDDDNGNPIIAEVYEQTYGENEGKKSIFKKVWNWFLVGVGVLLLLLVLVANIAELVKYYSSKSGDEDDVYSYVESDYVISDEYSSTAESAYSNSSESSEGVSNMTLTGAINDRYEIEMYLSFADGEGWYRYLNSGSGDKIYLKITYLSDSDTGIQYLMELKEYVDGNNTGTFQGTLMLQDGMMGDDEYYGTFTNSKGKSMGFDLKITRKW